MGYEIDVFLSYTTELPFGDWVHKHFLPLFEPYLNNALDREAELFVDKNRILSGDAWPERIKKALSVSRCMVAVWSPAYFRSNWCLHECAVMLYRERQLGYRTIKNPSGLIVPVNAFDGEHFPDFAKKIQWFDCRNFARVSPAFKYTKRHAEFEDLLVKWVVNDVTKAINNAPRWSKEWQMKEWLDDPINDMDRTIISSFKPPVLE